MFTGIVRERGRVVSAERNGAESPLRLRIAAPQTAAQTELGDSVAVSGCCLTAVEATDGELAFDAVAETLSAHHARRARRRRRRQSRAGFARRRAARRALRPGPRRRRRRAFARTSAKARARASGSTLPEPLLRYCVEKGSIAVDGVSLTVAELDADGFAVALVPHTLRETTLGALEPGDQVNLEADVLAKYVERLATPGGVRSGQ